MKKILGCFSARFFKIPCCIVKIAARTGHPNCKFCERRAGPARRPKRVNMDSLTSKIEKVNEENQKPKKGGRPTKGIEQKIPDEVVELAEKAKVRVGRNFGTFALNKEMTSTQLYRNLYPIIKSESHASRILTGERPVSLPLLVALHYQYGISLDEFVAGDTRNPQMSTDLEDEILNLADKIRQARNSTKP